MNTRVSPATPETMAEAARLLADGQLVAFPTETVYGLGANALDEAAVRAIFSAKDRPADNPLIVHVWNRAQLDGICEVSPLAEKLMDAFWPGPLTLLMPRKETIPLVVTAGLPTVAVRMPSHPVAAELLKTCNLPIAAPSANRSGKPSPTTAQHVYTDMDGRIPMIIDGGSCDVGLESTVLDINQSVPCILRPGGVTQAMLESVIGPVTVAGSVLRPLQQGEKALSPGMRYQHYAPKGQVTLVEGCEEDVLRALRLLHDEAEHDQRRACVMCFTEHLDALHDCHPHDIGSRDNPDEVAQRLFDVLRRLDDEGMDAIFSEVVSAEEMGLAVMNRLGRAAGFRSLRAEDVIDPV